jgi:hypothetical protein
MTYTNRFWHVSGVLAVLTLLPAIHMAQGLAGGTNPTGFPQPLTNEIREIANVRPFVHPSLGWKCAELGDLNGDGYDDYAVSSYTDTTWIFYGGDPIPRDPKYWILGGTEGLQTADFNGDGLIDIATSISYTNKNEPEPRRSGRIRIYLNAGSEPYFADPANQVIVGDTSETGYIFLGIADPSGVYHGIRAVDVNGDAKVDILASVLDRKESVVRYVLFLGGYPYSSRPDRYIDPSWDKERPQVWREFLTGDINGDGMTDMLLHNLYERPGGYAVRCWNVYLGNREAKFDQPYFVLRSDSGWYFEYNYPALADMNADGCDEIIEVNQHSYFGRIKFWYGRRSFTEILPDDSLFNPYPNVLYLPVSINPVGDLNGDGRRDVLVGWGIIASPASVAFYFHPNRPDSLFRVATGSVGVDGNLEYIDEFHAYPIGDVNGDGYDDIVILGRSTNKERKSLNTGFKIYGGTRRLVGIQEEMRLPASNDMEVYPNPAAKNDGVVHLKVNASEWEAGKLSVYDMLGRLVFTQATTPFIGTQSIAVPLANLKTGVNIIELLLPDRRINKLLYIYK